MSDEMVDVLDEFAVRTGQVIPKRQAHDEGRRHAAVHLWMYNARGEVLLQQRAEDKDIFPNTLDISIAGHLSAGDSPIDAAIREAEEEMGLHVEPEELRFVGITRTDMPIPPQGWMHKVYDWNFIIEKDADIASLTLQVEEVSAAFWIPLDDFERELHGPKTNAKYSPHPLYVYDLAIFEIRKALVEKRAATNNN